jgi:prepilin-type N-terminal cleavage/methylation domain-containing protein
MQAIQYFKTMTNNKKQGGFTLLEILLVVAAIAILAGIIIIAINPGKQLAETKNAQRRIDTNTIINAVYQYSIDNNGALPATITTTPTEICKTGATPCTGFVDLGVLTLNEKYLVSLPNDPTGATAKGTGYQISKDTYGRITVAAPKAEAGATIKVKR